jgi:hypothetical protein
MHIASEAVLIGNIMSTSAIETPSNSTMSIGALLSLDTVTFSQGSNVTGQAWTYPNSYAGVTGEAKYVSCLCCAYLLIDLSQVRWTWASLNTFRCLPT